MSLDTMERRLAIRDFVRESNAIEGIRRPPSDREVDVTTTFLALPRVSINSLQFLVETYAPGKPLREHLGMNVRVGAHLPPEGGPLIRVLLTELLHVANEGAIGAWQAHQEYESLHPFMDGNGRSGRALWLWMMRGNAPLGFLHTWYYQSLQAERA